MNPIVVRAAYCINQCTTISNQDAIYLMALICSKTNYFINATHENVTHEVHPTIRAKSNQTKTNKTKKVKSK